MENLVVAMVSFVSAMSCSLLAKRKRRETETWFTLGLIFWFLPLLILYKLPSIGEK